jgi:NAD(P)H-dependent FMN reductase
MTADVHVVALCGSRRDDSKTRIACRTALEAAAETGADTTLVDLREFDLPPLDPDAGDAGDAAALRSVVDDADAIVLGTPNYHGSYSGVLKNALDYLGRDEIAGKTVGLLEVAGGSFPKPAMAHLRGVCRTLNAWTLPLEVGVPRSHETVGDDAIVEESIRRRVRRLGREVAEYAGVDEYPAVADGPVTAPAVD